MHSRSCALLDSAFAILACVAPPPAWADGDPASDYLVTRNAFFPVDADPSLDRQLADVALQAKRKGYPIKVAVIAVRSDLGAVVTLWRKPEQYAFFLAQELSLLYRGRLLIVMPNGYGIAHLGHSTTTERRALAPLTVARGSDGITRSAIAAVERLAASRGITVESKLAAPGGGRGDRSSLLLVTAALVGLAAGLVAVVVRRRT